MHEEHEVVHVDEVPTFRGEEVVEQADDDGNQAQKATGVLPVMKEGTKEFKSAKKFVDEGGDIARISKSWIVSKEIETKLKTA